MRISIFVPLLLVAAVSVASGCGVGTSIRVADKALQPSKSAHPDAFVKVCVDTCELPLQPLERFKGVWVIPKGGQHRSRSQKLNRPC